MFCGSECEVCLLFSYFKEALLADKPSTWQELVFQTALAVGMLIVNGDSTVRDILR